MNIRLAVEEHATPRLADIDAEIAKHLAAVRLLVQERTTLTMHQFVNDATKEGGDA